MSLSLTEKILQKHTKDDLGADAQIACAVDQGFSNDLASPLTGLLYEQTKKKKPACKGALFAVDHAIAPLNTLLADEQTYVKTLAHNAGFHYSRAGNGISHMVHIERFAETGQVILGTDFYTAACGAVGALSMTVTALELAAAYAGAPYLMKMPKVAGIELKGKLRSGVSGKDVGLELLRRLTIRGGHGKILEYHGTGVGQLSFDERVGICAMGAETGARASIFPADATTKKALAAFGRSRAYKKREADKKATYDETWEIDLGHIESLVANPGSPDNVVPAKMLKNIPVEQVCIGFSLHNLRVAAALLSGKKLAPNISLLIVPGTRAIYLAALKEKTVETLLKGGARILEPGYGPAEGIGYIPRHGGASLRTFYRNNIGGGKDQQIYLGSVETAIATALRGVITGGNTLSRRVTAKALPKWPDKGLLFLEHPRKTPDILRGTHIAEIPPPGKLPQELRARVMLKMGDNIGTAHIIPPGTKTFNARHNLQALTQYAFKTIDADFGDRCREDRKLAILVGGDRYGIGLAREYTALLCAFLNLRTVFALSFSSLHRRLLIYAGCLPLLLKDRQAYLRIAQGDELDLPSLDDILKLQPGTPFNVKNLSTGNDLVGLHDLSEREIAIIKSGGLIAYAASGKYAKK